MTDTTGATTRPHPNPIVRPCLSYRDPRAAIGFLTGALGFAERAAYGDGDVVHHAELAWPGGGGLMLGLADTGNPCARPAGGGSTYIVVADPDAAYARAMAAGARVVRDIQDEDYGGRGFTVADPEGNLWSFGSYPGE